MRVDVNTDYVLLGWHLNVVCEALLVAELKLRVNAIRVVNPADNTLVRFRRSFVLL